MVEIIDHRLIGAIHVDAFRRDGGEADDGAVFQTSTIESLLDGHYEGDLTVGELLAHGDLGLGTVDRLDGELVVLDGTAFTVSADGTVDEVDPEVRTPFAVVCHHRAAMTTTLTGRIGFESVTTAIDEHVPGRDDIAAVRVDGTFTGLVLRSVKRQEPPFVDLVEVVRHQREWTLTESHGSLVGFRFPDPTEGLEAAGWHLHFLSDDRTQRGHVIDVSVSRATLAVDTTADLHVELPAAVDLPSPTAARHRRAEMRRVEGRPDAG